MFQNLRNFDFRDKGDTKTQQKSVFEPVLFLEVDQKDELTRDSLKELNSVTISESIER